MEPPTIERVAAPRADRPEATAIEGALPRLASTLRPELERLALELEPRAAPAEDAPAAREGDAPAAAGTEPADAAERVAPADREDSPPVPAVPRAALARWLALRTANALAIPLEDLADRERIARELSGLLDVPGSDRSLDETEVSRRVLDAIADPLLRDALPGRLDRAAVLAVTHVLLGGPGPDAADLTPRVEETAGMGRRLVAYLLDYSLVICLSMALGAVVASTGRELGTLDSQFLGYLVTAFVGLVNVQLLSTTGTTMGKLALGLEVVRASDGGPPDLLVAFRREFLGRIANNVLMGIGYLAGIRDPLHQTWGDRIAGTVVIRLRSRRAWQRWARLTGATAAAIAVLYLPALISMGRVDERAADAIEREGDLLALVDSVFMLSVRPVASEEEMTRDLRDILALAPSVRARAYRVHKEIARLREWSDVLAPWQSGQHARLDSMYVLMERCMIGAEEFAMHGLAARRVARTQSLELRRRAHYAQSDLVADHEYLRTLINRLAGRPANG